MNALILLRKLAEYQQYSELKESAQEQWQVSNDVAILPLLSLACANTGLKKQAEQYLEQAQTYQAEYDADCLVDMSAVLIVMQRINEALTILNEVLAAQPDHPLAIARLAYCHMLLGNLASAQGLFEQAVTLAPQRINVLTNLANVYLLQSQPEKAQRVLDQAFSAVKRLESDYPDFAIEQFRHLIQQSQCQLWVASEEFSYAEEWLKSLSSRDQHTDKSEQTFLSWLSYYGRLLAEQDLHAQASDILREYLQHYPDNSQLCLQLAELAQVQGRFMTAVNLLHKAIKQDEENIALWIQLSSACLHRFDQEARAAAEKAVALAYDLSPSDKQPLAAINMLQAQAKNALAQVESQEQNLELAERLFREILDEHEYFLPALQGLGQLQMQAGHIDEALDLFERVKQIDPVKGYSALINARRFPENIETLEKIQKAAEMPSLEGKVRAGILFQLASAWEKRKDYDKAFTLAQRANDASKKFLPYNPKAHRNHCYRYRMRFSKPLYEHRKDCGVDSNLPIFVVGMPRSGTTLVEQILSGHSEIFGAGELGVIPQVIQGLNRWERHTGSGRSYPDCVDDLTPYVVEGIANKVLDELQEYAPDAKHVIDKLPHNFENIGLIKFLFPKAKIISVRRDPRDIAMSNYFTDYQAKHGGMGFAYDLTHIGEQLADHNLLMYHWQQTFPGEILELQYEDVVDDLEGSARKMLDYIGVAWDAKVMKFNELDRAVKTASVWQVRQPIYKTSKAKWKRYEKYLEPLLKGTNAKILPDSIENMLTLPEPGFLTDGVALYKKGELDGAEMSFKKMLHHNPEHAACNYMVGLVYLHKQHTHEGIEFIEKALATAPWHKEWRDNLLKAYELVGESEKAEVLKQKNLSKQRVESNVISEPEDDFVGLYELPFSSQQTML